MADINSDSIEEISKELLKLLACPVSGQKLHQATKEEIENINMLISQRKIIRKNNEKLVKKLSSALIREDGKIGYSIEDSIPNLLSDHGFEIPDKI